MVKHLLILLLKNLQVSKNKNKNLQIKFYDVQFISNILIIYTFFNYNNFFLLYGINRCINSREHERESHNSNSTTGSAEFLRGSSLPGVSALL